MVTQNFEIYSLLVKIIDWIKSFLTNRKQRVLVNGIASGWHDIREH